MDLVNQINKKMVKEAEEEILPEVEERGEGENQLGRKAINRCNLCTSRHQISNRYRNIE